MKELSFQDFDKYLLNQKGKIIHQIWFGIIPNKRVAKKAFESLKKYRESWITKNPNWFYVCWNWDKCKELVKEHYSQHLEMYNKYPHHIQRCDVVRYFILHRYGGLYCDADYICLKPWDEVITKYKNDIYLVETPNKVGSSNETHVSNSLMFSRAGHVFWNQLFIELEKQQEMPIYYGRHMTIMFTTGPGILNRVYNNYKFRHYLNYYPYKLFHPHGLATDNIFLENCSDVYAMHIGKGSWENHDSKLLIFVYQEYKLLLLIVLGMLIPYSIACFVTRNKVK